MKSINTKESKAFVQEIEGYLRVEGAVKVTGLGIFRLKATRERQGVNPKTGERITIPASKRVSFRVSSTLKGKLLSPESNAPQSAV